VVLTMVNVRKSILQQLKRTGRTRYWLARQVAKRMTPPTVYQYLSGKQDMVGLNIEILMDAVGLEILPKWK
jgi:hypothetical protein